jgi:hypothetical protein
MDEREGEHQNNPFASATAPSKEHIVEEENPQTTDESEE